MSTRGKINTAIADMRDNISRQEIRGMREGDREYSSRMITLLNDTVSQCEAIRREALHMLEITTRTNGREVDVLV